MYKFRGRNITYRVAYERLSGTVIDIVRDYHQQVRLNTIAKLSADYVKLLYTYAASLSTCGFVVIRPVCIFY